MEPLRDSKNSARSRLVTSAAETTSASLTRHARHGTKLQDILMSDKPNLSYADFHHELTINPDTPIPKYVGSQQSQMLERRNLKEEELVRYMSNLPSYLERGKSDQDKALNVGVLDWRLLEKWRQTQKQMPQKHGADSPSSTNTSLFSTDGSSTHSSRGQSSSPAHQRSHSVLVQSTVDASLKEGHVQDTKSTSGRGKRCSSVRHVVQGSVLQSNPKKVYAGGRMPYEIEVFGGNTHKFKDSNCVTGSQLRKESNLQSSKIGGKTIPDKDEATTNLKGKKKIQDVEPTQDIGRSRATKLNAAVQGCSERAKSGSIVIPRDPVEHTCSGFIGSASFTANDRLSVDPGEKFLLARNILKDLRPSSNESGVKSLSQASHTSPLSTAKKLQTSSNIGVQGTKVPTVAPCVPPSFPARMLSSPSRSRHTQEKKPSEESDSEKNSESIPKSRNPSPIRRLSFAMGKMIKNVGSRDDSPLRRSNSKDCIAKSGLDGADSSLFINNPGSDKLSTNTNRGSRSSPLRRLLDPLLKPRVSGSSEPSNKPSSSSNGAMKSCSKPLDFRPENYDGVHAGSSSSSDAHDNPNNAPSTVQALLQVSFKNGLPLFTFAMDNKKDILAATVRKSRAPGKGHNSWIYTFFTIHEVKRKSGSWLNPGGKSGNHGYVPNVVAQMKVSDSSRSSFSNNECSDDVVSREFDLFAVDVGQGDEYSTDFHPTNELAAIIVKLPLITTETNSKVDNSNYDWLDISQGSLRENSSVTRSNDYSVDNSQFHIVLPGGVHTVPSKGEISRLAQRWKSGGLCDCGGWDLGCQLRVYTNKKEQTMYDSFGICQKKVKLQLFSQVGQDNQPILSLTPFKERIYSVEFCSSLSLLQAFAVSVSFIDCKRPPELSEPGNVPEKVTADTGVFDVLIRPKMLNQAEVPGRYVSYPPHSPVGRV